MRAPTEAELAAEERAAAAIAAAAAPVELVVDRLAFLAAACSSSSSARRRVRAVAGGRAARRGGGGVRRRPRAAHDAAVHVSSSASSRCRRRRTAPPPRAVADVVDRWMRGCAACAASCAGCASCARSSHHARRPLELAAVFGAQQRDGPGPTRAARAAVVIRFARWFLVRSSHPTQTHRNRAPRCSAAARAGGPVADVVDGHHARCFGVPRLGTAPSRATRRRCPTRGGGGAAWPPAPKTPPASDDLLRSTATWRTKHVLVLLRLEDARHRHLRQVGGAASGSATCGAAPNRPARRRRNRATGATGPAARMLSHRRARAARRRAP